MGRRPEKVEESLRQVRDLPRIGVAQPWRKCRVSAMVRHRVVWRLAAHRRGIAIGQVGRGQYHLR